MTDYGDDLAYIHDVGFSDFARDAAPGLLDLLREAGIQRGLVVDVGCGSGRWAARLLREGYDVVGIDWSASMLRIARRRCPGARFRRSSFVDARVPKCVAVTAIGECLNYAFDARNGREALGRFFGRVHRALEPKGLLVFDLLAPLRVRRAARITPTRAFQASGRDWAVFGQAYQDGEGMFVREITTFRRVGRLYRRQEEVHRQHLYRPAAVLAMLRDAGFAARTARHYGHYRLRKDHSVFIARKLQGIQQPSSR